MTSANQVSESIQQKGVGESYFRGSGGWGIFGGGGVQLEPSLCIFSLRDCSSAIRLSVEELFNASNSVSSKDRAPLSVAAMTVDVVMEEV